MRAMQCMLRSAQKGAPQQQQIQNSHNSHSQWTFEFHLDCAGSFWKSKNVENFAWSDWKAWHGQPKTFGCFGWLLFLSQVLVEMFNQLVDF